MNDDNDKKVTVTILVNLEPKSWDKLKISYEEVVHLAFPKPSPPGGVPVKYTVEYTRGPKENPHGSLTKGHSVFVANNMVFTVDETGRS